MSSVGSTPYKPIGDLYKRPKQEFDFTIINEGERHIDIRKDRLNPHGIREQGLLKLTNGKVVKIQEDDGDFDYIRLDEPGKGGMIVLSTDVNATAGSGLFGRISSFIDTLKNRLFRIGKSQDAISQALSNFNQSVVDKIQAIGYSIGQTFRGRYFDSSSGSVYDEKSFSLQILGVPQKLLMAIGKELGRVFNQKQVLIVDYNGNNEFLLNTA